MILKIKLIDDKPTLVSWMESLPTQHSYYDSNAGVTMRTHDIKRCLSGERKTAGGFIWREVAV